MIEDGLSDEEARHNFWICNRAGVLHEGRTDLTPQQRIYARSTPGSFEDVIRAVDATILIGLSTVRGAFTEPIVREMARNSLDQWTRAGGHRIAVGAREIRRQDHSDRAM